MGTKGRAGVGITERERGSSGERQGELAALV